MKQVWFWTRVVAVGLLSAVLGFWLLVQWTQYQAMRENLGLVLQVIQQNIAHQHLEPLPGPVTPAPAAAPAPAPTAPATPAAAPAPAKPKG